MIPEPHPYDPDNPDLDDFGDLGYLLPDGSQRGDRIDPLDPNEY